MIDPNKKSTRTYMYLAYFGLSVNEETEIKAVFRLSRRMLSLAEGKFD